MKTRIAMIALMAAASTPMLSEAQRYDDRWRGGPTECWNPRAGHFEAVRPGERQDDLDFSRCRPTDREWGNRYSDMARECWNPRAGHYEAVRPGERQNDLDYNRCYPVGERNYYRDRDNDYRRECWNPRAGHYEAVRPGERQNDLDFSRCRRL